MGSDIAETEDTHNSRIAFQNYIQTDPNGSNGNNVGVFGSFPGPKETELHTISLKEWSSTFAFDLLASRQLGFLDDNGTFAPLSLNLSKPLEAVVSLMEGLARSVHSTIQADLGQSVDSNILAHPQRLISFINQTARYGVEKGWGSALQDASGDPWPFPWKTLDFSDARMQNPEDFYEACRMVIPEVKPAVLTVQYLCQIPKIKSPGSLIIKILVADLVFLQTLWKILNWTVTLMLERRDPYANHCAGCEKTASATAEEGNDEESVTKISVTTAPTNMTLVEVDRSNELLQAHRGQGGSEEQDDRAQLAQIDLSNVQTPRWFHALSIWDANEYDSTGSKHEEGSDLLNEHPSL